MLIELSSGFNTGSGTGTGTPGIINFDRCHFNISSVIKMERFVLIEEKVLVRKAVEQPGHMLDDHCGASTWSDIDLERVREADFTSPTIPNLIKKFVEINQLPGRRDDSWLQIMFLEEDKEKGTKAIRISLSQQLIDFLKVILPDKPVMGFAVRYWKSKSPEEVINLSEKLHSRLTLAKSASGNEYQLITQFPNLDQIYLDNKDNCFKVSVCIQWKKEPEANKSTVSQSQEKVKLGSETIFKMIENLHEDEDSMDLIIVAGIEQTKLKCHKKIFVAQSHAFKVMVYRKSELGGKGRKGQATTEKSQTVQMEHYSVDCVKLLISYMYGKEFNVKDHPSCLILELFQLANQYDLVNLRSSLTEKLLAIKDISWWAESVLVELYCFVKDVDSVEKKMLRDHALELLASAETDETKMRSSAEFQRMSQNDKNELWMRIVGILKKKMHESEDIQILRQSEAENKKKRTRS